MSKKRQTIRRIAWTIAIWIVLEMLGVVRLTYPYVVSTECVLQAPVKVARFTADHIVLTDGRELILSNLQFMTNEIAYCGYLVDLEPFGNDPTSDGYRVFVNKPRGFCGTALGGMIYMPFIPIPIRMEARRRSIGQAWLDISNGQQSGARDGSFAAQDP